MIVRRILDVFVRQYGLNLMLDFTSHCTQYQSSWRTKCSIVRFGYLEQIMLVISGMHFSGNKR